MPDCIHIFCNKKTKKKIFYCGTKIRRDTLCCKNCGSSDDIVVCLHSMNVYCKKENHFMDKRHVLFYDLLNKILICTFCEKETPVMFKRKEYNKLKDKASNLSSESPNVKEETLLIKYMELPKVPHRIIQSNILKGFQNLGNTCYINALFHILLNLSKFKNGIINEDHPIKNCENCLICNIKQIIKRLEFDKELTLKELINCIMNVNEEYKNDDQHDIHTFYLNFIEIIQKHTKKSDEDSFVYKLFYGSMSSTLRCLQCNFKRHTIETFCSISLNHTKTLNHSLEEYFLDEHIQDKLHCLNCKGETVFSKSLEVKHCPEILVIHIMRFKFISTVTKINDKIEIHEEIFVGTSNYKLQGFVQHRGSIEHGHYVSYMLLDGNWYEFDDDNVRKMLYRNVPFQDAYLLFFSKSKNKHVEN